MTPVSSANLELALVLPLGVIANQLMKVEGDLRLLSMRAGAFSAGERGTRAQIAGQMDKISETLESIRHLLANFEADLRRKPNSDRDD